MSATFDFSVRRRDVAWALALVVLLSAVWVARSDLADAGVPPGTGIVRVYIATGVNFPDALGVGPGSALGGAPIILVPTNPPIPTPTANELARLDPRTVVIIGGTSAVSQAMEDALVAFLPNADVSRIAGSNRYETNAMFSAATFPVEGWASVNAAAFTASTYIQDVEIFGYAASSVSTGTVLAGIQLPHGAEILELQALVTDNDGADEITVSLRAAYIGTTGLVASVSSSGTPAEDVILTTTIAPSFRIVDNESFTYYLEVSGAWGNPSPFIKGVMVRYRLGVSNG